MDYDYDRYLSQKLAEHEQRRKTMCECEYCGCDLYEGEECYYIDSKYYCERCIDDTRVMLDTDDLNPFGD